MKVLIFAAGLGTRLKPLTDTRPKALVPVCGIPLLEHLILKLKRENFTDIVINVHHFASQIIDYVNSKEKFGLDIVFSDETDLLRETGGGIKYAAKLLNDGEPFLVHNVDILSNLDLTMFYRSQYGIAAGPYSGADSLPLATLLVSERETERYLLFDEENNLCAWINLKTGEFKTPFVELKCDYEEARRKYFEFPRQNDSGDFFYNSNHIIDDFLNEYRLHKYAFAGIHTISPAIFPLMLKWPDKFSIIDFYLSVSDKYDIKPYVDNNLQIIDVGRTEHLKKAEDFCRTIDRDIF